MRVTLLVLFLSFSSLSYAGNAGSDWSTKRHHFLVAQSAFTKNDLKTFREHKRKTKGYPLYPWLELRELDRRLGKEKPTKALEREVQRALTRYKDWPLINNMKNRWLGSLYRAKEWKRFRKALPKKTSNTQKCRQLHALLAQKAVRTAKPLFEKLFLVPRNQSKACNPGFAKAKKLGWMTPKLIWQRGEAAAKNKQRSLAGYLAKQLPKNSKYRLRLQRWLNIHDDALGTLQTALKSPSLYPNALIRYGMWRLSDRDVDNAAKIWPQVRKTWTFSKTDIAYVEYYIALDSAIHKREGAVDLLMALPDYKVDRRIRDWRLRASLATDNWEKILSTYHRLSAKEQKQDQWQYWRARALERLGQPQKAATIYTELATKDDYYAFMSADRIGRKYVFRHQLTPRDTKRMRTLALRKDVQRAREFYLVGMEGIGRREWRRFFRSLKSRDDKVQAALLAHDWGWYSEAMRGMANTGNRDNLAVMYPIAFGHYLIPQAREQGINAAWVYGLVRSESLFIPDIKSPVGALGLMQIMPATGKRVARKARIPFSSKNRLLDPGMSSRLGTRYMSSMAKRFWGNEVLATAAYNAGPHRVDKWLPKEKSIEMDVWIDTIPFRETRDYVKRVMGHSVIFDWRLDGHARKLRDRFPKHVNPAPKPDA